MVHTDYEYSHEYIVKVERRNLVCYSQSARYNLTVKYPKGLQVVNYTLDDVKPLELGILLAMQGDPEHGGMEAFTENVTATLPRFNEAAILDALTGLIDLNNSIIDEAELDSCGESARLENGTSAFRCTWSFLRSNCKFSRRAFELNIRKLIDTRSQIPYQQSPWDDL